MTQREKLLNRARENPNGLRFDDFETLLAQCDWALDRQSGSHRLWHSPQGYRLPIQEGRNGKAKQYQVEQFLHQYSLEKGV